MGLRRVAGHRRTIAAGAATAALVLATASASDARATPTQAPAPAGLDTANAAANVFEIAPKAGSLAFAIGTGEAIAEVTGGLAQALAQSADLGLIGSSLTEEQCDGSEATFRPEDLPQPTQVDNRQGDTAAESTEAPFAGENLGFGLEQVAATTQPASRAVSTTGDLDLSPALRLDGGRAVSEAEVVDGGREARALVGLSVELGGGALRIDSMRWTARHRTGTGAVVEGAFTVGALELLGVPIPAEQLEPAAQAINDALAPAGLRIELPRVERLEEPVDLIRVTPLRILVADSEVGATVVRPGLEASQELRAQLFDALVDVSCHFASVLLVGEIGVGVASGTGALVIELGGVEARSAELVTQDAFGDQTGLVPPAPAGSDVGVPSPGVAPGSPRPALPPAAGAPGTTRSPTLTFAPGEPRCESVHPFRWPSCSQGAAGAVGLLGAVATAGAAVLDLRRRRSALVAGAAP